MANGHAKKNGNGKKRAGLTPKQERFVLEYLIDLNATQAAIRSGYSKKTANEQASRLLANVSVAAEVEKRKAKISAKLECTADDIAREIHKLGFANMADYMKAGEDGDPYLDFSSLTREQAAALQEVTVESYMQGGGEAAREVRRVKFKLADKRASLVDLGKLLGFFKDRHEHAITGAVEHKIEGDINARLAAYDAVLGELASGSAGVGSSKDGSREPVDPKRAD